MAKKKEFDYAGVKKSTDIAAIIQGSGVPLRRKGSTLEAICPFHGDSSPSMTVDNRKYHMFHCWACGTKGDVFDFVQLYNPAWDAKQVFEYVSGTTVSLDEANLSFTNGTKFKTHTQWECVTSGHNQMPSSMEHWKHGVPKMSWTYRDANGNPLAIVSRFDSIKNGKPHKEVLPMVYATNLETGEMRWRWMGFYKEGQSACRPLMNLDKLASRPDAKVLIVEGEKTCQAAEILFPDFVVTTWMGGGEGERYADWSPIHGRDFILSPDNDKPGIKTMNAIGAKLVAAGGSGQWLTPAVDEPKWDLADYFETPEVAAAMFAANVKEFTPVVEVATPVEAATVVPTIDKVQVDSAMDAYFTPLGYEKVAGSVSYFFYVKGAKKLMNFTASGLTKPNLISMAPLSFWESTFPKDEGPGFMLDGAQSTLIQKSERVGIFDVRILRGCGAWMDAGRAVIHVGNKLFVDGVETEITDIDSEFLYERQRSMEFKQATPLTAAQASELPRLLGELSWEKPHYGDLLAGWCAVAPICGAMPWRSHIWLTGGAGTGKSWTFNNVIKKLTGKFAMSCQSATTAAYIRQELKSDARPVIFDEAEANTKGSTANLDNVLEIMRASSTEDGGVIGKGSAGGTAVTYQMRSMFAFASIVVGAQSAADKSRITVLSFKTSTRPNKDAWWKGFSAEFLAKINPDFVDGLAARTFGMIPTILANTKTFTQSAASILGDQRAGDQVGPLLAGWYSLKHDGLVSLADATRIVSAIDWNSGEDKEEIREEKQLLNHIMAQVIQVDNNGTTQRKSVGELLIIAGQRSNGTATMDHKDAESALRNCGIRTFADGFAIAGTLPWTKAVLKDTPWLASPVRLLERLDGASNSGSTRFSPGVMQRAVKLPWSYFDEAAPTSPQPSPSPSSTQTPAQVPATVESEVNAQGRKRITDGVAEHSDIIYEGDDYEILPNGEKYKSVF